MQPIRIDIPGENPLRKDVFVCTEFSVSLATRKIVAAMHVEQFHRTATPIQEVLEDGTPGPNGWTEYGAWEPYRRYHPSGQYPVHVTSDTSKLVDATFALVEPGTEGAVPEVLAIWGMLGAPIEQLLRLLMGRMIQRGNLEDLSQL
ncbi:hypothetical protein [Salmonirosea aquatica]|uniref:Uncharacterized protein n=1 Tax=Salmonirosea aquatica TaxID=2654236 RepID=A0A7C9BIM6_9BACT|nr:hypothetical protein [Cytophagaceae bacterium SJW1-29]